MSSDKRGCSQFCNWLYHESPLPLSSGLAKASVSCCFSCVCSKHAFPKVPLLCSNDHPTDGNRSPVATFLSALRQIYTIPPPQRNATARWGIASKRKANKTLFLYLGSPQSDAARPSVRRPFDTTQHSRRHGNPLSNKRPSGGRAQKKEKDDGCHFFAVR